MRVVVDAAGRSVAVPRRVSRAVLAEGRILYALAILETEDPFARLAGWADDLAKFDPDAFRRYKARFPGLARLAVFGNAYASDFSVERAAAIDADLVIFPLGLQPRLAEGGVLDRLDRAGIPFIFVDFLDDPVRNAAISIRALGAAFDREARAESFVAFHEAELGRVATRIAAIPLERRPLVFVERAAGYAPECCQTFGPFNYGQFVALAGGRNWGSARFSGFGGKVNPEAVFVDPIDVVIGTGANWSEAVPDTTAVLLGYDAKPAAVQARLAALAARPGWRDMQAVRERRFFSIYHQFYNGPYFVVAIQAMAKWLHPEAFADLDPVQTFATLHRRFLPIEFEGVFWSGLP
ncbi:MAG: ABC transporter substrate-binding protein [Alphaproteobacteria bacterium]|nr:ABC transporter substrate-binding protein [Alphaproteobacteria bacterium]